MESASISAAEASVRTATRSFAERARGFAATSSSAAVVANTVSLRTSTRIYQARFDSDDWSGSVLSIPVDPVTGALQPAEWDVAVWFGLIPLMLAPRPAGVFIAYRT